MVKVELHARCKGRHVACHRHHLFGIVLVHVSCTASLCSVDHFRHHLSYGLLHWLTTQQVASGACSCGCCHAVKGHVPDGLLPPHLIKLHLLALYLAFCKLAHHQRQTLLVFARIVAYKQQAVAHVRDAAWCCLQSADVSYASHDLCFRHCFAQIFLHTNAVLNQQYQRVVVHNWAQHLWQLGVRCRFHRNNDHVTHRHLFSRPVCPYIIKVVVAVARIDL